MQGGEGVNGGKCGKEEGGGGGGGRGEGGMAEGRKGGRVEEMRIVPFI